MPSRWQAVKIGCRFAKLPSGLLQVLKNDHLGCGWGWRDGRRGIFLICWRGWFGVLARGLLSCLHRLLAQLRGALTRGAARTQGRKFNSKPNPEKKYAN